MREHQAHRHNLDAPAGPAASRHPGKSVLLSLWRPARPEFTMFMTHTVRCPVCRMMRLAAGAGISTHLHVHRSGDMLAITEADDVHRPGHSLHAVHLAGFAAADTYKLLDTAPAGVDRKRFVPAVGVVTVGWANGRRTLHVTGTAGGRTTCHATLYDAIETVC